MPLNRDWHEFLELLNSNGVEYLVVGAFAVAFHGFPRYTADLDVLVRPTGENAKRVLRALSEFGFGKLGIEEADLCLPGMVIQLGVKPNRIDLLTAISGVSFEEAWTTRSQAELEDIAVNFIGKKALLRNKEQTGRAKISATQRNSENELGSRTVRRYEPARQNVPPARSRRRNTGGTPGLKKTQAGRRMWVAPPKSRDKTCACSSMPAAQD